MAKLKLILSSYFYTVKLSWKVNKLSTGILVIFKLVTGIMPFFALLITQNLINKIEQFINGTSSIYIVISLFMAQLLITFASVLIDQIVQVENKKMENTFNLHLRKITLKKLQRISFAIFEDPQFQNSYQRINLNQNRMTKMTYDGLDFMKSILSLFFILWFLLNVNWLFIPILILGIIPLLKINMRFGDFRYEMIRFLTPYSRKENYISYLLNHHDVLKEVRTYNLENFLSHKWLEYFNLNANKSLELIKRQNLWLLLAQSVLILTYAISGIYLIYLLIIRKVLIGSFVAVLQAIQQIQGIISSISNLVGNFYESSLHISEFRSFMGTDEANDEETGTFIDKISQIKVEGLDFKYPGSNTEILRNINFEIQEGKRIAIVGANGSGKTTLLKCLIGLYDAKSYIKVNGHSLDQVDLHSYRKRISILFQDYNRYEFTAQENVGFGSIEKITNLHDIRTVSKVIGIDNHIMSLPYQYETQLGKLFSNGQALSGGQWQKIAIARSLFRNSDLIILDEPTASLDPKSEGEIMERIFESTEKKALLYITHRLGAASLADEILVIKNGEIIEKGTHEVLMNLNSEYKKMYQLQSEMYATQKKGALL